MTPHVPFMLRIGLTGRQHFPLPTKTYPARTNRNSQTDGFTKVITDCRSKSHVRFLINFRRRCRRRQRSITLVRV